MEKMVPDPYKALNIPHDATKTQIKTAYRNLALRYHPDRLTRQKVSEAEMKMATDKFSKISAAYALLTDEKRKREYDHIFKYGGFDHLNDESEEKTQEGRQPSSSARSNGGVASWAANKFSHHMCDDPLFPKHDSRGNRVPQKGVGYAYSDPVAYVLSRGKHLSTAVAGVQIPSRMHLSRQAGGGLRFAFASGECRTSPKGTKVYTSKTTQFVSGKKFSRVETTTVHKDGRKEIIIEGDNYIERRFSPPTKSGGYDEENVTQQDENHLPWYMSAWRGIRESITMCYTPCIPVR